MDPGVGVAIERIGLGRGNAELAQARLDAPQPALEVALFEPIERPERPPLPPDRERGLEPAVDPAPDLRAHVDGRHRQDRGVGAPGAPHRRAAAAQRRVGRLDRVQLQGEARERHRRAGRTVS
jgi:hypothetical protein